MTRRTVAEAFSHTTPTLLLNTSSPLLITDDRVGVEVEVEGVRFSESNLSRRLPNWCVTKDSSLREVTTGRPYELIFDEPMFGADVVNALNALESTLCSQDTPPVFSYRTSVHVHLDVRDLDATQLASLVMVYLLVEDLFFQVGGSFRAENPYCVPLKEIPTFVSSLSRALNDPMFPSQFIHSIRGNSKYGAVNLECVQRFGSVEFRHHRGTFYQEELLKWINMILALKRYVVSNPPFTVDMLEEVVCTRFSSFLSEVFRGVEIPELDDFPFSHLESAVKLAKTLIPMDTQQSVKDICGEVGSNSSLEKVDNGLSAIDYIYRVQAKFGYTPRDTRTLITDAGLEESADEEYDEEYDEEGL